MYTENHLLYGWFKKAYGDESETIVCTLSRRDHCRSLPEALLSCADKKVSKDAAEDLPYGPQTPQTAKRGSEPTAARGGGREVSEWQRSAGNKPASSGKVSAGHRNRGSNQFFQGADCILAAPFGNPLEMPQKRCYKTVLCKGAYAVDRSYLRVDALREESGVIPLNDNHRPVVVFFTSVVQTI